MNVRFIVTAICRALSIIMSLIPRQIKLIHIVLVFRDFRLLFTIRALEDQPRDKADNALMNGNILITGNAGTVDHIAAVNFGKSISPS